MSLVEEKYAEGLMQMKGAQKVLKTTSLFSSLHQVLSLQVQQKEPGLSPKELRRKIAERLYASDPAALNLLKRLH